MCRELFRKLEKLQPLTMMIRDAGSRHDSSVILVTHDWNIMIVREHLLQLPHEEVGYPGFLDGLSYYRPDGREALLAHTIDGAEEVTLRL